MKQLIRAVIPVLLLIGLNAQAENQSPFVSITLSPFAAMNADAERYGDVPAEQKKFNMNLHQGYGIRASAWNMYISYAQSVTERDTEIPNARFTAISAGFLLDEMADTSYPISLYSRFGAGLGSGNLQYAESAKNEKDPLWEVFAEGGMTFFHNYQLGLQGKMQGLFEVGDTRALLGEIAVVLSVHF